MNQKRLIIGAVTLLTLAFLSAGIFVRTSGTGEADDPTPTEGQLVSIEEFRPAKPDISTARPRDEGVQFLRDVPGIALVLDAVASRNSDRLINLLVTESRDCVEAQRHSTWDCAVDADDGVLYTVTVDYGTTTPNAVPIRRVRVYLDAVMAEDDLEVALAAHDSRTPTGDGGTYFVVFRIPPLALDRTTSQTALLGNRWVATGFGLVIVAGSESSPVMMLTPLSETYGGLKWVQHYTPEHQQLILPESLDDFRGLLEGPHDNSPPVE